MAISFQRSIVAATCGIDTECVSHGKIAAQYPPQCDRLTPPKRPPRQDIVQQHIGSRIDSPRVDIDAKQRLFCQRQQVRLGMPRTE